MKTQSFTALAAFLLTAAPAAAKPAEVELHIEASAQVMPDRVEMPVTLTGTGATEAEARADLARQEMKLFDAAAGLGISKGLIGPESAGTGAGDDIRIQQTGYDAACAAAEAAADAARDAAAPAPAKRKVKPVVVAAGCEEMGEFTAQRTQVIRIDGAEKFAQFMQLSADGDRGFGRSRAIFSQSDPVAAASQARAQALAKARTEADAYAEAMGYRVVRVVRVSNARPVMSMYDVMDFIGSIDGKMSSFQPGWFGAMTVATVAVDYVIAPK